MQMFKWVWIVILSGFIATASLPSVCLAKDVPQTIRVLKLANGGILKQMSQNNRLRWTSLDKTGKGSIAHGAYKLQNGKVIRFNKGVYVKRKSTLPTRPNTNKSLTRHTIPSTKAALENSLNNLQRAYARFLRNPNDIKTRGIFNNALDNATADADRLVRLSKDQDPQLARNPQKPSTKSDSMTRMSSGQNPQLARNPQRPSTKSDSMTRVSGGQNPQLARTPQRPSTGVPPSPNDNQSGRWAAGRDDIAGFKGNVPIRQEDVDDEDDDNKGSTTPQPSPPPGDVLKPSQTKVLVAGRVMDVNIINLTNGLLADFSNIRSISRTQTRMNTRSMNILNTKMNNIKGKAQNLAIIEPICSR